MFNLTRPCTACPFRCGQGQNFRLSRLAELRRAIAFQCHRTVDYGGEEPAPGPRPEQCAGLLAVLWREGGESALTPIAQVALRTGHFDPEKLDPLGEAYPDWRSAMQAHRYGRDLPAVRPLVPGPHPGRGRLAPGRSAPARRLTAVPVSK